MARPRPLAFAALLAFGCAEKPAAKIVAPVVHDSHRNQVDALARPFLDGKWTHAMVVALALPAGDEVYGYGRLDDGRAPDGRTRFEIGSVTKAFTGLLLADMAARGEVTLDEPVQKLLPQAVHVPDKDGRPIRLVDLATHTSGLPRLPGNFHPADPRDPYADYTVEKLYAFLSGYTLARAPGEAFEYSNLGMSLLGHALALRGAKSYDELLRARVLGPLGMGATSSGGETVVGHDVDLEPAHAWHLPGLEGAGALRSTAEDLLKLVHAFLRPPADATLARAMREEQTQHWASPDGKERVGLAWQIGKSGAVWHNGETGGFHSFVAFDPARGYGVVVLSDSAQSIDDLGVSLLKVLRGEPPLPAPKPPVAVDAQALARLAGVYDVAPGFALTITSEGERLYVQATGQPRFRLWPESATHYRLRVVDASVDFGEGALTLHQNGRDIPGVRRAP